MNSIIGVTIQKNDTNTYIYLYINIINFIICRLCIKLTQISTNKELILLHIKVLRDVNYYVVILIYLDIWGILMQI